LNKKHLLIMALCCSVPLAALMLVFLFKVPTNGLVSTALVLLCPAAHIGMMFAMRGKHHGHETSHARRES
jgi:hypothetical protein